jgi:hypothetical protein
MEKSNCRHFFFDRAFESSEKKLRSEDNEDKDLTEDSRTVKQLILMTQTKQVKEN